MQKRIKTAACIAILMLLFTGSVTAKTPEPELCPTIGVTEWGAEIARCYDWEFDNVCYPSTSGMLICLKVE
jgi:hypothetical protein